MRRFPMGHDRAPSRRKMFHIRSIKRKFDDKLRQKINSMSQETLKWHSKYVHSENELAVRMRDAEKEKDDLSREASKWRKKYMASENEMAVRIRDAEKENSYLCQVITELSALVIGDSSRAVHHLQAVNRWGFAENFRSQTLSSA